MRMKKCTLWDSAEISVRRQKSESEKSVTLNSVLCPRYAEFHFLENYFIFIYFLTFICIFF